MSDIEKRAAEYARKHSGLSNPKDGRYYRSYLAGLIEGKADCEAACQDAVAKERKSWSRVMVRLESRHAWTHKLILKILAEERLKDDAEGKRE